MATGATKTRSITVRDRGFPRWKINTKVIYEPDQFRHVAENHIKSILEHILYYEYALRTRDVYFAGQRACGILYDKEGYDENMNVHKRLFIEYYDDIKYSKISVFVNSMSVRFLSVTITQPNGDVWDIDIDALYKSLSRSD